VGMDVAMGGRRWSRRRGEGCKGEEDRAAGTSRNHGPNSNSGEGWGVEGAGAGAGAAWRVAVGGEEVRTGVAGAAGAVATVAVGGGEDEAPDRSGTEGAATSVVRCRATLGAGRLRGVDDRWTWAECWGCARASLMRAPPGAAGCVTAPWRVSAPGRGPGVWSRSALATYGPPAAPATATAAVPAPILASAAP